MFWLTVAVSTAGAANWAEGLFTEKAHDFGPVPRGGKFRHEFLLINRLAEPVTILNVRASCGCTTGRAGASQVAPGQSDGHRGRDGHAELRRPEVDDPVRHAGDRRWQGVGGAAGDLGEHPQRCRAQPRLDRLRRGGAGPGADPDADHRPHRAVELEDRADGLRQPGADRAACRDGTQRFDGPVHPDAGAQARCTGRDHPGRDPHPDQRPRDRQPFRFP